MLPINTIARTLFAYLATITGLPVTYYVDSTELATTDHLRVYLLPATSISNGLPQDSATKQAGILQINVFVKAGKGANIKSGDYIEILSNAFQRGTRPSGIEFNSPPNVNHSMANDGFLMTAIDAKYTILS
jgi:hypothetical protein